jgi:hypothetical protein
MYDAILRMRKLQACMRECVTRVSLFICKVWEKFVVDEVGVLESSIRLCWPPRYPCEGKGNDR